MNKSWLQELIWNVWFVFDLLNRQFINFIIKTEDGRLETIRNQLEFLSCEIGRELSLTIVVEPQQITILMFILVEHFKVGCTLSHLRWNGTCWLIIDRPVSSCEDFNAEFYTLDAITLLFSESRLQFFA